MFETGRSSSLASFSMAERMAGSTRIERGTLFVIVSVFSITNRRLLQKVYLVKNYFTLYTL